MSRLGTFLATPAVGFCGGKVTGIGLPIPECGRMSRSLVVIAVGVVASVSLVHAQVDLIEIHYRWRNDDGVQARTS